MKKLMLLCALSYSIIVQAQESFTISPEIGYLINFPELNNIQSQSTKNSAGGHLGIHIRKDLSKDFSIGTAILYNTHRTQFKYNLNNNQEAFTNYNLNYIRIPVNLNYNFRIGTGNLVINAGPYLGYGVRGFWDSLTRIIGSYDIVNLDERKIDWGNGNQQTKPVEFGFNAGVSYALRKGLFFKVQYSRALNKYSVYNLPNIQNQFVSLCIGYDIIFKKKETSNKTESQIAK